MDPNASPDPLSTLQSLASNAAKDEKSEPGPGDVSPTTTTTKSPLVTLPALTKEEVDKWWKRVEASDTRINKLAETWDILLGEYLPKVSKTGEAETVKVPKHFRNVHTKIGQLFIRTPDPILTPKDPSPAQNEQQSPLTMLSALNPLAPPAPPLKMEDIISVKQAVLQDKMGRDGINYGRLMDQLLFDVLAWAGIGCSKIGYTCVTMPVQEPVMEPDPTAPPVQPGSMLGLSAPAGPPPMRPAIDPLTGQPKMQTTNVPIFEDYYERRFSPKKLITNADLHSSMIDTDAVMMGMHFYISPNRAKAVYGLTDDEAKKGGKDEKLAKHTEDSGATDSDLLHGVELWVRASHFYPAGPNAPQGLAFYHPQLLLQLVLIEGVDRVLVWRPSPDQTLGPDGRLTDDSLVGFPIKVLTIRDLADSPFAPSDSAFTNGEIKQLNTWRRQSVEIRDVAIGHYLYDSAAFDDEQLKLLKSGKPGRFIPVEENRLAQGGDKVLTLAAQVHQTADDARNQEVFSQDIDETLGISRVQAGAPENTVRSATEIATVQTSVAGRNEKERGRCIDFYIDSCRKLDQLLMRYADQNDYVHITGEDGARRMMVWNNQIISGRYIYEIEPDSQLSTDNARDYQLDLNLYNLTANDPLANRQYLLRRLARRRGIDPMKFVLSAPPMPLGMPSGPPAPGQPTPAGAAPSSPMVPPHGGPAAPAAPINKHIASNTGGRPNEPGAENHREVHG